MQTKYLIVIEKTPNNLSAFSPDLPGCVATGSTREEAEKPSLESTKHHCAIVISHRRSLRVYKGSPF